MLSQVINTTPVSELMNATVITVLPTDTMMRAKEIFEDHEFHHIPVVKMDGRIVGMLSRTDYYRVLSCQMLFNTEKNESYNNRNLEALLVEDVMKKNVVTVQEMDSLSRAANLFRENHFHALPVINEAKELQGILTTYDLLIFAYN